MFPMGNHSIAWGDRSNMVRTHSITPYASHAAMTLPSDVGWPSESRSAKMEDDIMFTGTSIPFGAPRLPTQRTAQARSRFRLFGLIGPKDEAKVHGGAHVAKTAEAPRRQFAQFVGESGGAEHGACAGCCWMSEIELREVADLMVGG